MPLNSQTRPDVAKPNTPTNANAVPKMNLGLKTYCDFLKNLLLSSNGLRKTTFKTPSIIAIDQIYFGNVNGLETKTWTRAKGCCASTLAPIDTPTNAWQKRSPNPAGQPHPDQPHHCSLALIQADEGMTNTNLPTTPQKSSQERSISLMHPSCLNER